MFRLSRVNMNRGKLTKVRRIVRHLDSAITLCDTDKAFGPYEYREIQAMVDALLRARMCAANIQLRLGDDGAYRTQPHISIKVNYDES